jgi:hypothetical protein
MKQMPAWDFLLQASISNRRTDPSLSRLQVDANGDGQTDPKFDPADFKETTVNKILPAAVASDAILGRVHQNFAGAQEAPTGYALAAFLCRTQDASRAISVHTFAFAANEIEIRSQQELFFVFPVDRSDSGLLFDSPGRYSSQEHQSLTVEITAKREKCNEQSIHHQSPQRDSQARVDWRCSVLPSQLHL